ncbi:MAG: alpha/beta hydrolase [Phycisphaeraceae bacterium]|nr:alpha/beta hydrolase [Phycisphaeraceae bacterium]
MKLLLNLYIPEQPVNPPLVVYIHGGAWQTGDHTDDFALWLTEHGYAVAGISYRYSSQSRFPAQIHDCKGAVRWLRAQATRYGYDARRIAAMGCSAGGHLAVLLGASEGHPQLEGQVAGHLDRSSSVQCVVDFFGPADFILRSREQPDQTEEPGGRVYQLLGKPVKGNEKLAKLASGAWHLKPGSPPILILHGRQDQTVFLSQSIGLRNACQDADVPVELYVVDRAGHGGPEFCTPHYRQIVLRFLATYLVKDDEKGT